MKFPKEVRDAGIRLRQGLQHHLGLCTAMLGQQDFAEPSLADDLQDVELVDQIHLSQKIVSSRRAAAHDVVVIDRESRRFSSCEWRMKRNPNVRQSDRNDAQTRETSGQSMQHTRRHEGNAIPMGNARERASTTMRYPLHAEYATRRPYGRRRSLRNIYFYSNARFERTFSSRCEPDVQDGFPLISFRWTTYLYFD